MPMNYARGAKAMLVMRQQTLERILHVISGPFWLLATDPWRVTTRLLNGHRR